MGRWAMGDGAMRLWDASLLDALRAIGYRTAFRLWAMGRGGDEARRREGDGARRREGDGARRR